jgi:hypothetical protein
MSHKIHTLNEYAERAIKQAGRRKARTARQSEEDRAQRRVVAWARTRVPRVMMFHVPNELSARSRKHGAINKARGVEAGVPDLIVTSIPPRSPDARGIAIEMKGPNGVVSDAQKYWLESMRQDGWIAMVCYSADEAISRLTRLGL